MKRLTRHEASSLHLDVNLSRESLGKRFESERHEIRIVIVSRYGDPNFRLSFDVVVNEAPNKQSVEREIKRRQELTSDIRF